MATSLSAQLKKLAAPQTSILSAKKIQRSILFESSEAAKYGRDIYYEIGLSGFEDLAAMNKEFLQFQESLFGKTSKDLQRAVKDKAFNKKLDDEIEHFMLLLSPYLEKQAALKALEWLVYRFMANEMNKCAFLMCIFPYYESALFVRILQIIDIHKETDEWHWLRGAQKSGKPVPKQTVFTCWGHNQAFRGFLTKYLKKMLKVHRSEKNQKIAISFYVTTVVGGLCLLEVVKEEHLSYIVKMFPLCLSSQSEIVAGAYFIIAQLSIKTKFSQGLINDILRLMIQVNTPPESLMEQCVLCLLALTHHQKIDTFNNETIKALVEKSFIVKQIDKLAKTKSIAPFLSAYVTGYIRWLFSNSHNMENNDKVDGFKNLILWLKSVPMSSSDALKVLWSLFEAVKNNYAALVSLKNLRLAKLLHELEASHPEGHSQAVARMIDLDKKSQSGKEYEKILMGILTTHSGTTSFVHMVHPDDDIRLAAVKNFVEKVAKEQEKDANLIKMHTKNMLTDEFPAIVLEGLTFTKGLKMLDVSCVVNECQKLLAKSRDEKNKWKMVRKACLRVLSQKLVDMYDSRLQMSVLFICLPYVIFPRNNQDMKAAKIVLNSSLTNSISLLGNLSRELSPYLLDDNVPAAKEYSRKVWKVLPQVLSTLSKEEHKALWNHVDSQFGSENCLFSLFMSLILLYCGLGEVNVDQALRLKMAHRLVDVCLLTFDMFKGSVNERSQNLDRPSLDDLAEYLEQVKKGSLPVPFLAQCLQQVVQVFRLPDICNTSPYWSPFMENPAEEGNLMLLVKALKGAIQLERFGDIGYAFRNKIVATVLKDCLGPKKRYYFLAILWGWHGLLSFSNIIDETLQAWTLKLGSALLSSQSSSLTWALGTSQPIVPALISALTHASAMVRCEAINCIKKLNKVIGGRLSQSNHSLLLEAITAQAEELIADESYVSSLLSAFANKPKSESLQVTQALIEVVVSESVPMHLKAALLFALSYVTNSAILRNLLPVANSILKQVPNLKEESKLDVPTSSSLYSILIRFTPETCEVLGSEDGWELFLKAITCSRQVLDLNDDASLEGVCSPQSVLMNQVLSHKFFTSITNEEVQSQLWSILISRVVESEDPSEAAQLRKGLRKVSLDAAVVITQIEGLKLSDKVTSIRAAQARRKKRKEQENHSSQLLSWRKLGLMLETIGVMASLGRPWLLVGPLSQCLQHTLTLDTVITDVIQQQIFSALLHLLQKSVEELGEDVSREVQLNIELIVQCIRTSLSPDTHRRAMLILAFAVKISPDMVMHNMMSIFTFMGTSLLRRDDSYSFQVIHQTIQSIIPALTECEKKENLSVKLAQVCQVFVDALPDLPEHRRLPLFTQLAATIDATRNLWIILALMADSHVMKENVIDASGSKGEGGRGHPQVIQFALTLCSQFPIVAQVYACCQLMEYISNIPEEKEDTIVKQRSPDENTIQDNNIICWDLHSPRQMCHFKYTGAGVIAHLLSSEKFIGEALEVTEEQKEKLQELYKQLMERTLCYLRAVTVSCEQHKDKPGGRLFLSLQRRVIDVVDGVNAVLPPSLLTEVTKGLMTSPLPLVRCRAMEILCAKLQPNANFFREEDIESLKPYLKILRNVALDSKEPSDNRQTALFTLHLLIKHTTSQVPMKKIQRVLAAGVDLFCGETEPRLMTQALLVVSEAVVTLKAHCITHLGQLMPGIIKLLDEDQDSEHLLLAAITAVHKVVENVPQLLSPYLESLVCCVCRLCTSKENSSAKESRLDVRLALVRDTLVKQTEPRVLIPKLTKAYKTLSEADVPALQTFMAMVELLVSHVDSKNLMSHKPALLDLFTQAMDLRTEKGDSEAICTVEANVSCALGKLLLRLNENDNIAIFHSLHKWAVDATDDKPSRLITFYRFADHVAGTFKVLFIITKMADSLFSHAAVLLERNNSLHHEYTVFGSGDEAERKTSVLLKAVLDTLTKIFLYDSVSFINQERFQLMVKPLTDQLENTIGGKEAYNDRITNHLVPCIIKFTIAVGDDFLWKTLNQQILLRLRNDDQPMVILAALQTFSALMKTLGEDYLQPLLADTMPYITEVLESLDTDVEAATRDIFTKMEEILGDNLRAYLEY